MWNSGPSGVTEVWPVETSAWLPSWKLCPLWPPQQTVPNQTIIQIARADPVPLLPKGYPHWERFVLDSRMFDWMSSNSTDTEVDITVLQSKRSNSRSSDSDVEKLPPTNGLYKFILSSFDFTKKLRVLAQRFEERARCNVRARPSQDPG